MDNESTVMRQQMDQTLAGLTAKLGELEHQLSGTVKTVKDSVNTVRDTFDLKLQVRQRPWTLLAGATALGFLSGFRPGGRGDGGAARNMSGSNTHAALLAAGDQQHSDATGATNGRHAERTARLSAADARNWLANMGESFQPEIAELKGIVIGTLLALAREMITKQVSARMGRPGGDPSNDSNGKSRRSNKSMAPANEPIEF
jgi:ElaB/YqjD/DUF883 family membrane-anchored ribosome-binding protein